MLTFEQALQEAREELKLMEALEMPSSYLDIMPTLVSIANLNLQSNNGSSGSVVGNIPTKIKFLKYIWIPSINFDVYGTFRIGIKFQAVDNTPLQQNPKIIEAITTLLEKSGLKIDTKVEFLNGLTYFKSNLNDKLDKKTFMILQKLFKSVLTQKNLDSALKPILGDKISINEVAENYIKAAKLKVESTEEKVYHKLFTIKTKDPASGFNELAKVIKMDGKVSNSKQNLKITYPIQFNKYISISVDDGKLLVLTYDETGR